MKIVLIRHGMTEGNTQKKYIGCATDESLVKTGREILEEIRYPNADKVFVSPMKRCRETAEIIFPKNKAEVVEDLREIDFGIFEGKNHNELNGNTEYQKWLDSGGLSKIPEGESFAEFCERCCSAFENIIKNIKNENIAFVIHGGTIMAILSQLGGYNCFDYIAENGKGYICSFENNRIKVEERI